MRDTSPLSKRSPTGESGSVDSRSKSRMGKGALASSAAKLEEIEVPLDVRYWQSFWRSAALYAAPITVLLLGMMLDLLRISSVALGAYVVALFLVVKALYASRQRYLLDRVMDADEDDDDRWWEDEAIASEPCVDVVPAAQAPSESVGSSAEMESSTALARRADSQESLAVPEGLDDSERAAAHELADQLSRIDVLMHAAHKDLASLDILALLEQHFPDAVSGAILAALSKLRRQQRELDALRAEGGRHILELDARLERQETQLDEAHRLIRAAFGVVAGLMRLDDGESPFRSAAAFHQLVAEGEIDPTDARRSSKAYLRRLIGTLVREADVWQRQLTEGEPVHQSAVAQDEVASLGHDSEPPAQTEELEP